jgi:histidinol-phosphate aminotransferase
MNVGQRETNGAGRTPRAGRACEVTRAVVLAAGMGSRLGEDGDATPKPLRSCSGVPLLLRVLRTLASVGIREAVIVLGYEAERIRQAISSEPPPGLRLLFVENPRYAAKNGVSLLAAAGFVDRDCLLTMSDHLYSPELVRRLLAAPLPEGACALGVDYDAERCFDIDDATKVRATGGLITDIGKELQDYDALDTGVFRIGPELLRDLRKLDAERGDCSLSDGVRALARRGRFHAVDVGDVRWIDVDTPAAMRRAEAMIRIFGDLLGDEPGLSAPVDPEALETFAPTWVRAARPYNEDHFAIADERADLARMMSNESPYAPSPRVVRAIVEAATRGNLYPGGARALRNRLGERDGFDEASVMLGAGSAELIDVVIRAFVAPGEEVLLSVPTFSMYEARTRVVGGIPVLVPMSDDQQHDVASLIRAVNERTKLLFLCTPNNPTGNRLPEPELRRLLRLGLPTVIDEAYWEFGGGRSEACLVGEFPNAIVLRTFSKAFGLAGMRLGYALAHPVVIRLLSRVKVPWNVASVTIAAAMAALDDAAEIEARVDALRTGRQELAAGLGSLPGVVVVPGEGNFVLVDVSGTRLGSDALVAALLAEGVLIRQLASHHAGRSYVRVTVGTPQENRRCLAAFERAIGRLGRRSAPAHLALGVVPGDAE